MASGSGKNQDDTETKEPVDSLRQREESSAAADADATESPPLARQSEITEAEVHGPLEAGGRNPSAATDTAAAAEQKGEETSLFWSACRSAGDKPPLPPSPPSVPAGGKPSLPPRPLSVSRARGPSSASIELFNEPVLEVKRERSGEAEQKDKADEMPRRHDEQELHIAEIIRHYNLLEMVAGRGVLFHSHALMLRHDYSAFRPVHEDGECFYRSFIFPYLEQVLDRHDTHEEHRVLAAVKAVARQHARLGWDSEFYRSHKAFKKLIKKVIRWKTHKRWKHVPTVNSYRIEKLLEFFYDNKSTVIFPFLRLVAAIWICSHSEEFVPLIPELNEGYTLTEWCFQEVIQRKVFTDHIQITALVSVLRVPLRVECLFEEAGQVYTQEHYHIIYPYHPDGPVTSGEWKSTAAAAELPPLALQSIIEEEVHGPPEGIWDHNDQEKSTIVWPKKGTKLHCGKCHFSARRNMMIGVVLILSILLLPTKTVAFQHFDNIEDAAQRLGTLNTLGDLRLQLEDETAVPGVGFNFFLHPFLIAVYTVVMMGILLWFYDPKEDN